MGVEILVAVAAFMLAAGAGYRRLGTLRRAARAAGWQIDNHLQRRRDQVARLLGLIADSSIERGESRALAAALRQAVDACGMPARSVAENELTHALRVFLTAAGEASGFANQPRLGGLCEELVAAEEPLSLAAQAYNRQVMAWNRTIHQLPWSWLAGLCHFQPIEYFVLDDPAGTGGHERSVPCWSSG
jgi:hypothetical protein